MAENFKYLGSTPDGSLFFYGRISETVYQHKYVVRGEWEEVTNIETLPAGIKQNLYDFMATKGEQE